MRQDKYIKLAEIERKSLQRRTKSDALIGRSHLLLMYSEQLLFNLQENITRLEVMLAYYNSKPIYEESAAGKLQLSGQERHAHSMHAPARLCG